MLADLQDINGGMSLKEAWPKFEANEIAINAEIVGHKASAEAHNATAIVFTPGDSSLVATTTDGAIKELSTLTDALQSGDSSAAADAARVSTPKAETFGTLKLRLDAAEEDTSALQASIIQVEDDTVAQGAALVTLDTSYTRFVAGNSNNLISEFLRLLQSGNITSIFNTADSLGEGYGASGHVALVVNTNNGKPVIYDDGAGTKWYEALYTDRSWANLFREWLATNFPAVTFTNGGIGGKTTTFALANKAHWGPTNKDVEFVLLGTNDKYPSSLATWKSEMISLLAYKKTHCNLLIVLSAPPSSNDFDSAGAKYSFNQFTTADIDRVIGEICNEYGYPHISFYREMLEYCKRTGFNPDHLNSAYADPHQNDFGHDLMWWVLQKNLGLTDNKRMMVSNQVAIPQLLIDGNFQIPQLVPTLGTAISNPAFNTYPVFDMWKVEGFLGGGGNAWPTTINHSQAKITDIGQPVDAVPGSKFCYRISFNSAGVTNVSEYGISQWIKNGVSKYCVGTRYLYASFWARSSVAGKVIQASAYLNYGSGGSPSATDYTPGSTITLSTTWAKYSFAIPIPSLVGKVLGSNLNDYLAFKISLAGSFQDFSAAGHIEITQAQLSTFSSAPFSCKTFDEELNDCMAFLEKSYIFTSPVPTATGSGIEAIMVYSNTLGNFQSFGSVSFKKKKNKAPTVVIYPYNPTNTNRVSNGDSSADLGADSGKAYNASESGFGIRNENGSGITTNNNLIQFHWVADARLY